MTRFDRWVVAHRRTDRPGYRFVCTMHWTRFMATDFASSLAAAARVDGHVRHVYTVERRLPHDFPGRVTDV